MSLALQPSLARQPAAREMTDDEKARRLREDEQFGIIDAMTQHIFHHITVDQGVRFGKPVIEGTRIPVDLIVGKIAGGMTADMIMQEYNLTREQVMAALEYAAHLVAEEEIIFA